MTGFLSYSSDKINKIDLWLRVEADFLSTRWFQSLGLIIKQNLQKLKWIFKVLIDKVQINKLLLKMLKFRKQLLRPKTLKTSCMNPRSQNSTKIT